jgi:hypothetical protein
MKKTKSQASFAGRMSKKKYAIIVLIILAITVGHFAIQMSFIESENKSIVESLAKTEPIAEPNPQPQIDQSIIEDKFQDSEVKKSDVVLPPPPLKLPKAVKAEKIVQKEPIRPPEPIASKQKPLKKEFKHESQAERLRRAEMILTGF